MSSPDDKQKPLDRRDEVTAGLRAVEAEDAQADRDDEDSESEVERTVRRRLEAFIPDLVKRTFFAGISAVATTEEGLRKVAKEMSLPKDAANYLASTAQSAKDEVTRIIAREIREFLQNVNLSEELAKILTMVSFEIKTEIRFIPNDEKYTGVEPDVKANVRLKRQEQTPARPSSLRRRLRRKKRSEPDS